MTIERDLREIAAGDRAAFTRLYRATRAEFVRYATGLLAGDHAAAEDAVDDAFVAIWSRSGRYDGHGSANGWIRRIVRNKAIDLLRKRREVPMSDEPALKAHTDGASDAPTPFDCAAQNSDAGALRAALRVLSFDQREAVWLCYFDGKSLAEIAYIVECPENTVKTRLFHARQILAKTLAVAKPGFDRPGAGAPPGTTRPDRPGAA